MTTNFINKDKSQLRPYFNVLTSFVIVFGIYALTYKLLDNFLDKIYKDIIIRLILLTASIVLIYLFGQKKWKLFKFTKIQTSDIIVIFFILGLFALNNLIFIRQSDSFGYKSLLGLSLLNLTIGSISEECFYRGFIQTYINKTIGQKKLIFSNGNYLATTLMTITHIGFFTIMSTTFAFTSILLVAVFSLIVGYLRDKSDGIILPIITHLLVNYIHFFIQTNY